MHNTSVALTVASSVPTRDIVRVSARRSCCAFGIVTLELAPKLPHVITALTARTAWLGSGEELLRSRK